jgi:hypothetical protein
MTLIFGAKNQGFLNIRHLKNSFSAKASAKKREFLRLNPNSLRFFVSFLLKELIPFFTFTSYFKRTNDSGYPVDYALIVSVSADKVSPIVDVNVAGFTVKTEAFNIHCRLG